MNPDEATVPKTNVHGLMKLANALLISIGLNYIFDPWNEHQLNE